MQWKDSDDSVKSKTEEPEAFYEEEYSPLGVKAGAGSQPFRRVGNPVIWIPVVVIILILLYMFLPRGNETNGNSEMKALEARLDQVEKRMLKLESVGERVLNLEKIIKDNGTIDIRLDRLEASFAKRMDQVDKELIQMRKDLEARQVKKTAPPPTTQQIKTTPDSKRQHIVKKGDTLYSISRSYGLSVDRLREINKLDKNSVIFVGQKLNVN
jgi:LysM repeat protein